MVIALSVHNVISYLSNLIVRVNYVAKISKYSGFIAFTFPNIVSMSTRLTSSLRNNN